MPPIPGFIAGAAGASSFFSAITHSVVRNIPAIEAAFSKATRVTFAGIAGDGEFAANRQAWYKRFCEKMVEELCTRYGDLYMIWFDGGADDPRGDGPDVEPIVNKYHLISVHNRHWGRVCG